MCSDAVPGFPWIRNVYPCSPRGMLREYISWDTWLLKVLIIRSLSPSGICIYVCILHCGGSKRIYIYIYTLESIYIGPIFNYKFTGPWWGVPGRKGKNVHRA